MAAFRTTAVGRTAATEPRSADTIDGPIRIGDLATRAGVTADTLRYYERRGLLHPSGRRASGYREYAADAVGVVQFIKHAQVLGFTLAEIDELISLRGAPARRGAGVQVREVAVAKIADIEGKIRMLATLRTALADLVVACEQTCDTDTVSDLRHCPIIAALSTERMLQPNDGVAHANSPTSWTEAT